MVSEFHGYKVPIVTLAEIDLFDFVSVFRCAEKECSGKAFYKKDEILFRNGREPWNDHVPERGFRVGCWQCDTCQVRFLPIEVFELIMKTTFEE